MTSMQTKLQEFDELLANAKKVLITSHISPDLDAGCSSLAMLAYLEKQYTELDASIVLTSRDGRPYSWEFIADAEKIMWVEELADVFDDYDTVIFMDANNLGRFSNDSERLSINGKTTICIDHHPGEPDEFDLNLSRLDVPSAAQLVYELFFSTNKQFLSKSVSETIMLGILSDTGGLKFIKSEQVRTFSVVAELIKLFDLNIQALELKLSSIGPKSLEVFTHLLNNQEYKEAKNGNNFSGSYIDPEFAENYLGAELSEGNNTYKFAVLGKIKGCGWGFVLKKATEDTFSIAFRSTPGSVNVRLLAQKFDGGGHDLAAGGAVKSNKDIKEVFDDLLEEFSKLDLEIVLP